MKTTTVAAYLLFVLGCASTARGQTLDWTLPLGTNVDDQSFGVSADGLGSVYITGRTRGNLAGTSAGDWDAFLSRYDVSGTLQWTRQLGTTSRDESYGVSADGLGGVYISGHTAGSLGGTSAGSVDAFLSKYDESGTLGWTRQLGTSSLDESRSVSADGLGNVYISGMTWGSLGATNVGDSSDAFLSKYNADLSQWLVDAANANGFGAQFLLGDATLDGSVDSADLNTLALNWRKDVALWSAGDFTADGHVGTVDLNWLAINWQQSIPMASSSDTLVPEPSAWLSTIFGLALVWRRPKIS